MADPTVSFVEVEGCAVKVKRSGTGQPMLILHGNGGATNWLSFMAQLAEHYDVIVPEHPGFGGSAIPPWLDRIGDYANFYLEFLARLELRRVHIVGLSLGGWIAADLAVRDASRLASLTLIDAPGIHVDGVTHVDMFMRGEEDYTRDLFHDPKLADEMIARNMRPENEDVRFANQQVVAKVAWQPRFHDPQLQKWLHRIRLPTLIVWGENDVLLPVAYAEAWQRLIPGARRVVLPQCGHLPAREKADESVAAILSFCAQESVSA